MYYAIIRTNEQIIPPITETVTIENNGVFYIRLEIK